MFPVDKMPHHDAATYNSLISAHFHFSVLVHAFLDMLT
jgi:hypothetical protein